VDLQFSNSGSVLKKGNKMVIKDAVARGSSTPITDVGIRQLMNW
jgi:hypothetical protein